MTLGEIIPLLNSDRFGSLLVGIPGKALMIVGCGEQVMQYCSVEGQVVLVHIPKGVHRRSTLWRHALFP